MKTIRQFSLLVLFVLSTTSVFAQVTGEDILLRGGLCTKLQFEMGAAKTDTQDLLYGISIFAKRRTIKAQQIPALIAANPAIVSPNGCWARAKDVLKVKGGRLRAVPVANGPDHYEIDGLTADQLVKIFMNRW